MMSALLLAAAPGTAQVVSVGCETMMALGLARDQQLASCNQPLAGVVAGDHCWDAVAGAAYSPNTCAAKTYAEPPPANPLPATGAFEWSWLSTCEDGLADPLNQCTGEEVRCVDGTRPGFYVDWATDENGQESPTDRWIFYWSGGGGCANTEDCWRDYNFDAGATTTCTTAFCPFGSGQSIVSRFASWTGLLSGSPENDFHDWNRVRFHKCSDDSYQGTTTEMGGSVTAGDIQKVYHHGHAILRRTFKQLANVANFPTYPKLDDASAILLVGNSGGGKTLALTGDALRDFLLAEIFGGPDPPVEIRLVVDSQFLPALEHENALVASTHLYDGDQWFTPASAMLPDGEVPTAGKTYGTSGFTSGRSFLSIQAFQPPLDASCLATHPAEPERCNDEFHVLFHHITTPTFVRMDINDNVKREVAPNYADDEDYVFFDDDFRVRVFQQLQTWLERYASDSELATDVDTSPSLPTDNRRKPVAQNLAVWAPNTTLPSVHTGLLTPDHFGLPSAPNVVELEACEWATGRRGIASPETGFLEGAPTTVMKALHAWVSNGTAIDAVLSHSNASWGYRWQDPSTACRPAVPAGVNGLVLGVLIAGVAVAHLMKRRRRPRSTQTVARRGS